MSELKTVSEELSDSNHRVALTSENDKTRADNKLIKRIRSRMDDGRCQLRIWENFHHEKFESQGFVMKEQYMVWDSCVHLTLKELRKFYDF